MPPFIDLLKIKTYRQMHQKHLKKATSFLEIHGEQGLEIVDTFMLTLNI